MPTFTSTFALDVLIKASFVLLAGFALNLAFYRASAARRHLIWLLSLIAALLMPAMCAMLPAWRVLPIRSGQAIAKTIQMSPRAASTIVLAPSASRALHAEQPIVDNIPTGPVQRPPTKDANLSSLPAASVEGASKSSLAMTAMQWAFLVWAIGCVGMLARVACSWLALRMLSGRCSVAQRSVGSALRTGLRATGDAVRSADPTFSTALSGSVGSAVRTVLPDMTEAVRSADPTFAAALSARAGVPAHATQCDDLCSLLRSLREELNIRRPVTVLMSAEHAMPMTWGNFFPKVLLPAEALDWPAGRVRMALLHELAHVKRWDALAQLLGQLAVAAYWFHPLAWLAARGLWREQERAADDLVLSIERSPADYAQLLLDLAARLRGGTLHAAAIGMARHGAMENRLLAVLDEGRRRGQLSARTIATGIVVMLAATTPFAALRAAAQSTTAAAQSKPAEATQHFTGHIVASDGAPVGNAEIAYLLPWKGGAPRQAITLRAGDDGAFVLDAPRPLPPDTRLQITVRAAGFASSSPRLQAGQDNRVVMEPPSAVRVTFERSDGSPAAGLRVRPHGSTIGNIASETTWIEFPPAWSQEMTQITDADGQCVFSLPRQASTQLEIDDPHYAQLTYSSRVKTTAEAQSPPATIRLTLAGSVRGTVVYADTGKPAAGVHLIALSRGSGQASHGAYGEVVTDESGQYTIAKMGPATYVIHLLPQPDFPWTAQFLKGVVVDSSKQTYVPDMKLVRGSIVNGRIFKTDTGQPLARASISAIDLETHEYPGGTTTDESGHYSLRLPPGRIGLYLPMQPPQGYSVDGFNSRGTLEMSCVDGKDFHVDVRLIPKPGKTVVGRVVDPAGHPAPAAHVMVDENGQRSSSVTADDNGQFILRGITSQTKLQATANKMSTVTPLVVNGGEENVTLQLSQISSVTVLGAVVDQKGQPQRGVWIKIHVGLGGGTFLSSREPDLVTDAHGHFTIQNLRASGTYSLEIGGERFWQKQVELKFTPDKPTLDLGEIRLEAKY